MTCNINIYLANVTKSKYNLRLSQEQWSSKGATEFKRRIMGYCGTKTTKSVDELVTILTKMHSNHLNERESEELNRDLNIIASNLDNQQLTYEWGNMYFKKIESNQDNNTNIKYLITKC